jgi:hypothetical protein
VVLFRDVYQDTGSMHLEMELGGTFFLLTERRDKEFGDIAEERWILAEEDVREIAPCPDRPALRKSSGDLGRRRPSNSNL